MLLLTCVHKLNKANAFVLFTSMEHICLKQGLSTSRETQYKTIAFRCASVNNKTKPMFLLSYIYGRTKEPMLFDLHRWNKGTKPVLADAHLWQTQYNQCFCDISLCPKPYNQCFLIYIYGKYLRTYVSRLHLWKQNNTNAC